MGESDASLSAAGIMENLGVRVPEIFLPDTGEGLENWPVIACDQYTSSPEYWDSVRTRVLRGGAPSAYHLILPEIYLEHPDGIPVDERIAAIDRTMRDYLDAGVLRSRGSCFVLTDRSTRLSPSRLGLMIAIDLEAYDFREGTSARIRATEGTVLERIPPRLRIRRDAILEIPHVMLLADDPGRTILEPLASACASGRFDLLYDTDLPEGGGHVRGFCIPADSGAAAQAVLAMSRLKSFTEQDFLFAVGDGNHSLATAKTHWENIRSGCPSDHPARFALAELVNIHDPGLTFEPIHRILFGVSPDDFVRHIPDLFPGAGIEVSDAMSLDNAILMASTISGDVQPFTVFSGGRAMAVTLRHPISPLTAGTVQAILDRYAEVFADTRVDYIHGMDELTRLSGLGTGILLPALPKEAFFDTVDRYGALPRKTFSLGESFEKRYYMECRKIV